MSTDELEKRLDRLEKAFDALVDTVNKLMEDIYEPDFIAKLDKLAEYGQK